MQAETQVDRHTGRGISSLDRQQSPKRESVRLSSLLSSSALQVTIRSIVKPSQLSTNKQRKQARKTASQLDMQHTRHRRIQEGMMERKEERKSIEFIMRRQRKKEKRAERTEKNANTETDRHTHELLCACACSRTDAAVLERKKRRKDRKKELNTGVTEE